MSFRLITLLISALLTTSVIAANPEPVDLNKVSYSIGYTISNSLIHDFPDVNQSELSKGFEQGLTGTQAKYSKEEMKANMTRFQKQAILLRYVKMQKLAQTNKTEAEKFFADNKLKPGVVTLPSGLQYKIIKAAQGNKPSDKDQVVVKYTGQMLNGEVFDSNEKPGDKPNTFSLSAVIPGWQEALKLMPKGSIWEIYVPASLAYGQRGNRDRISPNAALIYKIQLIDIQAGN